MKNRIKAAWWCLTKKSILLFTSKQTLDLTGLISAKNPNFLGYGRNLLFGYNLPLNWHEEGEIIFKDLSINLELPTRSDGSPYEPHTQKD